MDAPSGSLIVYATAPGSVAADGKGDNGIFTKNLLAHLDSPGLEVSQMLKRVRVDVRKETSGNQTPWESSSLEGDFYFAPAVPDNDLLELEKQKQEVEEQKLQLIEAQQQQQRELEIHRQTLEKEKELFEIQKKRELELKRSQSPNRRDKKRIFAAPPPP